MYIKKLRSSYNTLSLHAPGQDLCVQHDQLMHSNEPLSFPGRVKNLLGYGPRGFHTLHLTVEKLAQQSFAETRARFEKISSDTTYSSPAMQMREIQHALRDFKTIEALKNDMFVKLREKYSSSSFASKVLLLLTGLLFAIAKVIKNPSNYDPSDLYPTFVGCFYKRSILLWTGKLNRHELDLSLVLGSKAYKLEIFDYHQRVFNTITFENRLDPKTQKTNLHITKYKVVSPEAQTLAARFLKSLRDHTNVFADITANFPLAYTGVLDESMYRHDDRAVIDEDGIEFLLDLQEMLDRIPVPFHPIHLERIAKVVTEGL